MYLFETTTIAFNVRQIRCLDLGEKTVFIRNYKFYIYLLYPCHTFAIIYFDSYIF